MKKENQPKEESYKDSLLKNKLDENKESLYSNEEIGGRKGLEPTRYGDWENKGKCVDF